jgi:hypothetical protein
MSASPVQLSYASTTQNSPTFVATAFGSNNAAGNLIFYAVSFDAATSVSLLPVNVTDTLGNTYTSINQIFDATNGLLTQIGYAPNILAGANTVQVDFGAVTANFYKAIVVWEWTGFTTAPFTAGQFNGANQTSNSGTLSSGNTPTLATSKAVAIGFSTVKHALVGLTPMSAGSGWTASGSPFWDYGFGPTNDLFALLEYQALSSTAPIAATFATSNTSNNFDTHVAIFNVLVSTATIAWVS